MTVEAIRETACRLWFWHARQTAAEVLPTMPGPVMPSKLAASFLVTTPDSPLMADGFTESGQKNRRGSLRQSRQKGQARWLKSAWLIFQFLAISAVPVA